MRLLFVGDVMLGRLVNEVLQSEPPTYPWGDTLSLFRSADWRMVNLEAVISDRGEPWSPTEKAFHFRTDQKNIACLEAAQINAVSLANNHSLDFGSQAMAQMLKTLRGAGIAFAGAGVHREEAKKPAIVTVRGLNLGILSATDNEPAWEAGPTTPGIFYVPIDRRDQRALELLKHVARTKQSVDFLIVALHWGPNWGYRPRPNHQPFAHALIEAGADLIFGHSCHVFQGIELFEGKPILYSTGDFVDDYAVDEVERNDQSFVFAVELEKTRVRRLLLSPTVIRDFQARLATGEEAEAIGAKMRTLCQELGTRAIWRQESGSLEIPVP